MAVRWDNNFANYTKKVIRNYNAKVRRLNKKGIYISVANLENFKNIKEGYTTRKEVKRRIKEMEDFTKRGSEQIIELSDNIPITKYEKELLTSRKRRLKYNLTRQIKYMEGTKTRIKGEENFESLSSQNRNDYILAKKRREILNRNIDKMTSEQLEMHLKFVNAELYRQSALHRKTFRKNYYDMLFQLGNSINYDRNKLNKIKRSLDRLSDENFVKFFNEESYVNSILYYYPDISMGVVQYNTGTISNLYDTLYTDIDELIDIRYE